MTGWDSKLLQLDKQSNAVDAESECSCIAKLSHTPVCGLPPTLPCCIGPPLVLTCLRLLCSSVLFSKRLALLLLLPGKDTDIAPSQEGEEKPSSLQL